MRKLFSFKSSVSNSGTSNSVLPASNNEKVYKDTHLESANAVHGLLSPKNSPVEREYIERLDLASSEHKKSFSSPSPVMKSSGENNSNGLSDLNRSPSGSCNVSRQANDYRIRCRSLTPERQSKSKRSHRSTQETCTAEKLESSSSSRGYSDSVDNSSCSSPVPLRCRSARFTQLSNRMLDLYIDGEQHENNNNSACLLSPGIDNESITESRKLVNSRRPPRVQSTDPSSPATSKGHLRSFSFSEDRDRQFHIPSRDFTHAPNTFAKNVAEKLSRVLPRKPKTRYQDFESETTVDDIFEDYSRISRNEVIRLAKVELDSQRRRMEKEKDELQSSLEKELDRRSSDWLSKLDKYKLEEQRLRDRVRDLAEQNVSLHREVQCLSNREAEAKTRIMHTEIQLNDLTTRVEDLGTVNCNLQETLSELREHFKGMETERDCIRRSYREKEKENRGLQKAIVRLQRTCSEQEKTISGLRQGWNDEISKEKLNKDDHLAKLQIEQLRLTGVEHMLRKELESCKLEVATLRHENINLLDRLQLSGSGHGFSLFKLDQELHAQVDCLKNQGLSLLGENNFICSKLLDFIKSRACQNSKSYGEPLEEADGEFDDYLIAELDMKVQSFRRGSENFRRSLQMISEILHDKPSLESCKPQSQSVDICGMEQPKHGISEGDVDFELKAEILVTKVLRENLGSKEMELEQLQAELATSIRSRDILENEIRRAQDALSCLTHRMKDLELQMARKDEALDQNQHDLQECREQLTITRGILQKVSGERDLVWEEVKDYSEKNMLLNSQVNYLKKKIEALDEDILVKEGQITILKDNVSNKPFEILYGTKSIQELTIDGSEF